MMADYDAAALGTALIEHVQAIVDEHVGYKRALDAALGKWRAEGYRIVNDFTERVQDEDDAWDVRILDRDTGEELHRGRLTGRGFDDLYERNRWATVDGASHEIDYSPVPAPSPLLPPGLDLDGCDPAALTEWVKQFNEYYDGSEGGGE